METWDVLKCFSPLSIFARVSGLMETWDVLKFTATGCANITYRINGNMGCIEIKGGNTGHLRDGRLMETWDVLKSQMRADFEKDRQAINGNMGCIEICLTWKPCSRSG